MNRIYRLVFNRTLGLFQVASETARSHGKSGRLRSPRGRRLALVAAMSMAMPALATIPGIVGAPGSSGTPGNVGGVGETAIVDDGALNPGQDVTGGKGGAGGAGINGSTPSAQGGLGFTGGTGGAGVSGNGFNLTNESDINGGKGGAGGVGGIGAQGNGGGAYSGTGGTGGQGGQGGYGGVGGQGVSGTNFTVTNTGYIFGGSGGAGGAGNTGGQGGVGGMGINGLPGVGGMGATGGQGGSGGLGGTGGDGGAGVSGSGFTLDNSGTIAGGKGGTTGAPGAGGEGGDGGPGGDGDLGQGATGATGNPGSIGSVSIVGQGGIGVIATGNSTITNSGTIEGGWNGNNTQQATGIEVSGGGNTIINSGTIIGGTGGGGSAIELSDGGNTLELRSGSVITGDVWAFGGGAGVGDTLALGGADDDTFDVSTIGSQYHNFTNFSKAGDSTWTLTGTTSEVTSWNIKDGTLSISDDASLGAVSGDVVLAGGELLVTDDINLNHDIVLGNDGPLNNGGTLNNGGNTVVVNSLISGGGNLTLSGAGTTVFSNYNSYSGATEITEGTLQASGVHVFSSASAVSVATGATLDLDGYDQTIGSLAGAGNVTLGSATLSTGGDDTDTTFSGVIEGTGALVKEGTGNMTLSGTNTYQGGTTVTGGGSLSVSSDANLGNASGGLTLDHGTLVVSNDFTSARNIALSGDTDMSAGGIDNGGHNVELSGVISGATTTLALRGSGTTTLSGINTYGQTASPEQVYLGTAVLGGTVAVSSDANLGHANGVIGLTNGTLKTTADFTTARLITLSNMTPSNPLAVGGTVDNDGHNVTLSGRIVGSGGLAFKGSGTTTLSGSGTNYSGTTTVSSGTLKAGAINTLSSNSAMTVNTGATLNLNSYSQTIGSLAGAGNVMLGSATLSVNVADANANADFSGVISGAGGLVKSGDGTQTLSGVNTYLGATTISGGTLAINADASLGGSANALSLNGGALRTTANVSSARNITLFASEGGYPPLYSTIDNGGNHATFSGVISGTSNGGLKLSGSGTTTLSGVNTYTGTTNVLAGTLGLSDGASIAASATTVQSGATLSAGNATVGALSNTGLVSVGAGKTLTVVGNFSNGVGSTLRTNLTSADSYGKLVVNGIATLGGTLDINVIGNPALTNGGSLAGIIHANSIDGAFSHITDSSLLFDFTPVYTGTDVGLTIVTNAGNPDIPTTEAVVNGRGNRVARNAARVLDRVFAGDNGGSSFSPLLAMFAPLSGDEQKINDGVTQSLPLLAGGSQFAAGAAQAGINRVIQARLDSNQGLSSGDEFLKDNHIWLKGFGSWADQNDRNGVSGYDANVGGLAIGMDGKFSDKLLIGASFAYANASVDSNSDVAKNKVDVDVYQLVGYGSYSLDNATEVNFQLGAGVNKNQGKRELSLFNLNAKADYSSVTALAGIGLGHTFTLNEQLRFTPSVRADYTWVKDKGYTETGADALNLKVNNRDTDSLILAVDGKLNYAFSQSTGVSVNLGAGYDTLNDRTSITSAYAGAPGAAFTTEGLDLDPWLLRAGVGLTHVAGNGTEISLRYDTEKRNSFLNQTAAVKVRWAF